MSIRERITTMNSNKTMQESIADTLQKLSDQYFNDYQKLVEQERHCTECAEHHRLRNELLNVAKYYKHQAEQERKKAQ